MLRHGEAASPAEAYLRFGAPQIGEREIAAVVDTLRSGWIGTGPRVAQFQRALEDYLGVGHVSCVSSCTAALTLALRALEIGPGDEVLVPTMTFVATANAVVHAGATPVLIDSEPVTGLMDLAAAEQAITPRTKVIMPVHLAGRPLDMDAVNGLRDAYGLRVVEDAAHAIGAEWGGRKIGAHGNVVAYSFYVTKNITTIEGGALATDDGELAARVERLALHGLSACAWQRHAEGGTHHYEVTEPGVKQNMTDVEASLGLVQLPRLDERIEQRATSWSRYDALLECLPLRTPAVSPAPMRHARHLYQVLVEPAAPLDRDELLTALHAHRIGSGVHYRAVHLHPYYRDRYAPDPAAFPIANEISERTLSLPLGSGLTSADQARVVAALKAALHEVEPAQRRARWPPRPWCRGAPPSLQLPQDL